MTDYLADMAYTDARYGFENYRDKIIDKAMIAHDAAAHARAAGRMWDAGILELETQNRLKEARKLVYTGLMWQYDNHLYNEECYP